MSFNNNEPANENEERLEATNDTTINAWQVEDDKNVEEKDLERSFVRDAEKRPVREGSPAGGQKFGQDNLTPSANDKNNPSQYAGNTNAYFDRTEPSEEHPEDTNFKVASQDGSPDYSKAQPRLSADGSEPKPENREERGNGENDRPHEEESYQEGTVDNDEENIPGPEELPDQQKVGENVDDETFQRDHLDTK